MTFEDYKKKRSLKRKYKQYNEAVYHKDLRHMGIIRYNVKKIIKEIDYFCGSSSYIDRFHDTSSGL